MDPLQGVASGGAIANELGDASKLEPGSMISVQLLTGDMNVSADGTVTAGQLERMIGAIVLPLEAFDPGIRHVMATGRVDFSLAASSQQQEAPRLPAEIEAALLEHPQSVAVGMKWGAEL